MEDRIFSGVQCRNCGNNERALFSVDGEDLVCKCCGSWLRKNYSEESIGCRIAYGYLNSYRFEEAKVAFGDVVKRFPNSVDARWGLLLAEYRIVYIKGFYNDVTEPIYCFSEYDKFGIRYFSGEPHFKRIMDLLANNDELLFEYRAKAEKIDRAINNFKACKNGTDRDVFICVKISAST